MDINMICYRCMREKVNNEACTFCGYVNGSEKGEHYYLEEGTMINSRYLVGRVLGHGGFGITYIGFDTRLDIRVAIKEYLPSDVVSRALGEKIVTTFSGDKKEQFNYGLTRFLDEARSLARYNQHPCIVSTSDFFEENNTAYLVMEYLEGIPLNEYLKRKGGKISYDETLEIMMPIMDALREVHESGMIHRDISPDNIYITSKGQIKLLDFGAARFALGEKSKSLSVILKPGYAPPEQYSTKGMQGPWTDVYSVAATMYRMISGENISEAVDRFIDDTIDMPSGLNADSQEVLKKALKVKHDERYKSIEEFQDELLGNKEVNNKVIADNKEELRQENVNEELPTHNSVQNKNLGNEKKWIIVVVAMIIILIAIIIKVSNNNTLINTDITTNKDIVVDETENDKEEDVNENIITEEETVEEDQHEEVSNKDEEKEESFETVETENDIFTTTEENSEEMNIITEINDVIMGDIVPMSTEMKEELFPYLEYYARMNDSFSNDSLSETQMINFAIKYLYNDQFDNDWVEGNYVYIPESLVQVVIYNYFGRRLTIAPNIENKWWDYKDGKFKMGIADGEGNTYVQVDKLYSLGNNKYKAYMSKYVTGPIPDTINTIEDNYEEWKKILDYIEYYGTAIAIIEENKNSEYGYHLLQFEYTDNAIKNWNYSDSSRLIEPNYDYSPENVADSNLGTAWVEGAQGNGVGEWLLMAGNEPLEILEIMMINGYTASEYLYYANSRVKSILIEFSDGTSIQHTYNDNDMRQQVIVLDEPVLTHSLKFIILDTYPGNKYEDTCISEIEIN